MTHEREAVSRHCWRVPVSVATLPPYDHTNAYVIAEGGVGLVVDPGSPLSAGTAAIAEALEAAGARTVKGIVLTHSHADHTGGLEDALAAFDDPTLYLHAAESDAVRVTARRVLVQERLLLTVGDVTAELLHTPGHSPGHLSVAVRDPSSRLEAVLAGDLVAASGSVWVGWPEGDVTAYLKSLERLIALKPPALGPGHGPLVDDPVGRLTAQRAHRLQREEQVVSALRAGPLDPDGVTALIYPGIDGDVRDLARRSVLAHLDKLAVEGAVRRLADDDGPYALS